MRQCVNLRMSRRSGYRFADKDMRQCVNLPLSRRNGYRFADKDMRQCVNREHVSIPQERGVLW
jgi:hypothetical protein